MKSYWTLLTAVLTLVTRCLACPHVCTCTGSRVDCYGKELTQIPDDIPRDATYVDLQTNSIERVDWQLRNLSALEEVMLRFNRISFLAEGAFSDLPNLKHLNLGSNLITAVAPAVFQNLPKISVLDLTDNQLQSIDGSFQNISSLTKLVLTRNRVQKLTEEGLTPLTSLVYLMAEENRLSTVSPGAFSTLEKLSYMSLSKNPLTSLDNVLSSNEMLSYLDLSECQLESVPAGLPWALRYLQLSRNNISRVHRGTFMDTRFLGIVILDENDIQEVEYGAFSHIVHLEQIWLNGNWLTSFPSPIPSTVHTVNIDSNQISEITNVDFPENSKMTLLSLRGNKISSIEPFAFSRLTGLKKLYLSSNNIEELRDKSFAGLRNLTELDISRNPIRHIDTRFAAGLHALEMLDLSYVQDTEPFVRGNFFRDVPFLKTLSLRRSPWLAQNIVTSNETLKSFYHLRNLDLRDNGLQTVDTDLPRFFPSLSSLQLAGNAWVCDIRLLWLHDWMQRRPDLFPDSRDVFCALPMYMAGTPVSDVSYNDFFRTTTTVSQFTDEELLGSGEVTAEVGEATTDLNDVISQSSSRSDVFASIADENLILVSTSLSSSRGRTSKPNTASGRPEQGSRSEFTSMDMSNTPPAKTSSDVNSLSSSKATPSVTFDLGSPSSENTYASALRSLSTQPPSSASQNTTAVYPSTVIKPRGKEMTNTPEFPPPLWTTRKSRFSPRTEKTSTASPRSGPTPVVTPRKTTTRPATKTKPVVNTTRLVRRSTTFKVTTKSMKTTTTTTTAATTTITTASATSTHTTTTTTTTTPTTTTTKRTTLPANLNESGMRSPTVKGQTSAHGNASRITTRITSSGTATTTTKYPVTKQFTTNTTTTFIKNDINSEDNNHDDNKHGDINNDAEISDNSMDHDNASPRFGGSQNRMPSLTDASGPARTTVIAVSVCLIAIIVVLLAVAFALRYRRQLRLLYHRRFMYTVEHSDTAFVLADQDDDPDILSQVMTPQYRLRSVEGGQEREPMSRARGESTGSNEGEIAMFMWKNGCDS